MGNINQEPRDKNGNKHGEWLIYHSNGKLWYRRNFIHGVRHGLSKGYYPDGELMYRVNWNMGKKIGYWYYYGEKSYYLWLI